MQVAAGGELVGDVVESLEKPGVETALHDCGHRCVGQAMLIASAEAAGRMREGSIAGG